MAEALTRVPVSGVLRILNLQSDPVRNKMIQTVASSKVAVPFRDLVATLRNSSPAVSESITSHLGTELENEDLLRRQTRGTSTLFVRTELGIVANVAFGEYQRILVPPLRAGLEERLLQRLDPAGVAEVLRRTAETTPASLQRPIQEIALVTSHRRRLVLLCSLATDEAAVSFRELKRRMVDDWNERIPPSTLSNFITELVTQQLVKRAGDAVYTLTPVGRTSVRAFDAYQERVYPALLDSEVNRILSEAVDMPPRRAGGRGQVRRRS